MGDNIGIRRGELNVRLLTGVAFASIITGCSILGFVAAPNFGVAETAQQTVLSAEDIKTRILDHIGKPRQTLSGSYLASRHAQIKHDWSSAGQFIDTVLETDPTNTDLMKRALILSFGSQQYDHAFEMSQRLLDIGQETALSASILSLKHLKAQEYAKAITVLNKIPQNETATFVSPILYGWARAGLGALDTESFNQQPIHAFHAVLVADFIGQQDRVHEIITGALQDKGVSLYDLQRIAELQIKRKNFVQAKSLYLTINQAQPGIAFIEERLAILESNKAEDLSQYENLPTLDIKSASEGAAFALQDMAQLLYKEYSDESARLFSSMALYLDPENESARVTLASITSRNGRYDDAISYYDGISDKNSEIYTSAQKEIADLLKEKGHLDEAMRVLEDLVRNGDIDAQLQIGDYYRSQEDFRNALIAYNKAADMIGENAKAQETYWYLYYSRGIALERLGRWTEAEADLRKALSYQPNHPYVLNYLGYSWADQGEFLEEALEMIAKAVRLKPDDGFITDSLGWVNYKLGRYEEAVPYLERAVELEPYDPTLNDHLGDAYWQVGRKGEARFQWSRTLNYADSNTDIKIVEDKLRNGLSTVVAEREKTVTAKSSPASGNLNE